MWQYIDKSCDVDLESLSITMVVLLILFLLPAICAFLTDDKLPQFTQYGRSLVLVGGNLDDNNTAIYSRIVELAVSENILSVMITTLPPFIVEIILN